jgi:hypothetical protein
VQRGIKQVNKIRIVKGSGILLFLMVTTKVTLL